MEFLMKVEALVFAGVVLVSAGCATSELSSNEFEFRRALSARLASEAVAHRKIGRAEKREKRALQAEGNKRANRASRRFSRAQSDFSEAAGLLELADGGSLRKVRLSGGVGTVFPWKDFPSATLKIANTEPCADKTGVQLDLSDATTRDPSKRSCRYPWEDIEFVCLASVDDDAISAVCNKNIGRKNYSEKPALSVCFGEFTPTEDEVYLYVGRSRDSLRMCKN